MTSDTLKGSRQADEAPAPSTDMLWLEACLDLGDAPSITELERRLRQVLSRFFALDHWVLSCVVDVPLGRALELRGDTRSPAAARSGDPLVEPVEFALPCRSGMCATFSVEASGNGGLAPASRSRLVQLARVLASTLDRLYLEIVIAEQGAEISLVQALLSGRSPSGAIPNLDDLARVLLERLDVTVLQVMLWQRSPGAAILGSAGRRGRLVETDEQRQNLARLVEQVYYRMREDGARHVLLLGDHAHEAARINRLSRLAQARSLLVVPITKDQVLLGAIIVVEERGQSRQPITPQTIALCTELAASIAGWLTENRLLAVMLERGQFLQALVDTLADAVVTVKDDLVASWNLAAQQLFELRPEEAIGRPMAEILHGGARELGENGTSGAREVPPEGSTGGSFEWTLRTNGGQERWLLCTMTPMPDPQSDSPSILYVFREIGQERELEYLKDELLSSISHELRTPLNGIYGFGRLLLERPHMSERMRHEALESLQASIERLTRMADDFIDVARARRHRLPLQRTRVDLAQEIRSVVREIRWRQPDHPISVRIQKDLPHVHADVGRVKQILDNLVSNAAKYSPAGSRIAINARRSDDQVVVSVTDHGCGIPPGERERIFEPFFRADNSRKQRASGVGLGLSIVKSLVEAHDGQIEVRSKLDRGSTFTFSLPVAESDGGALG